MNATERLGLNIQNLRQSRGWTQEQLADEAGIDRSYISEIELGRSSATAKKLEQIARAFGVDISELHKKRGVPVSIAQHEPREAEPLAKLVCPKTGVEMGHYYIWDNGDQQLSVYPEFEERFFPKPKS
ncbi:MAG TPA: helix-turn-helix transcriptional regulator [Alphaproteobacteria bacterium]|jgi:transcriptional regulator with XRE-family HTH domain|nr:helix-turn-helix transcriptional regulator [Alphaproteobacteria bacterium]